MSDHEATSTSGSATGSREAAVPRGEVTGAAVPRGEVTGAAVPRGEVTGAAVPRGEVTGVAVPGTTDRDATAGPAADVTDLLLALEPAHRFRCDGCGNVTRFDVTLTETSRRFHHFDLGGDHRVEEEEILERSVRSVVCRWCGRDDMIRVEPAPVANT